MVTIVSPFCKPSIPSSESGRKPYTAKPRTLPSPDMGTMRALLMSEAPSPSVCTMTERSTTNSLDVSAMMPLARIMAAWVARSVALDHGGVPDAPVGGKTASENGEGGAKRMGEWPELGGVGRADRLA